MSTAQKNAIQKELVERATGKGAEPTWSKEPSQLQMVKALNFYSTVVDPEKIKQYAIAWAKKFKPDSLALFQAQPEWKFQTYGALMRMLSRELPLSKKHVKAVDTFVAGLTMPEIVEVKPKKRKKIVSTENANFRVFCDALDDAVGAKSFTAPKFDVNKEHSSAPVIELCNRELEAIKEDPTVYPEHMKKWFRSVLKIMQPAAAANDASHRVKKEAKPAKAPKVAPVAKVKKEKPAKVAKVKKEKKPAVAVATTDHPLNGKKVAYLANTSYGRIYRIVSDDGFVIDRKTIRGMNMEKSKAARIPDFGDVMQQFAAGLDINFDEVMKRDNKTGIPIQLSTRLNENVVFLKGE